MALAQATLVKPLMSNHHHGLWGYSGETRHGRALTVQSTGIGGPSTAAVTTELAGLGVSRAIRIGSAVALDLQAEEVAVASDALGLDGTSRALGIERPTADRALTVALAAVLEDPPTVTVAGYDLSVASAPPGLRDRWATTGAHAADGESAALLAAATHCGLAVAIALIIGGSSDLVAIGERAALAFDWA